MWGVDCSDIVVAEGMAEDDSDFDDSDGFDWVDSAVVDAAVGVVAGAVDCIAVDDGADVVVDVVAVVVVVVEELMLVVGMGSVL